MWFGTRAYMQEIRDPGPEPEYESPGWFESTNSLRGGLGIAQSKSFHREYAYTWDGLTAAQVRQITDYADGVYGDGLLYWYDESTSPLNALPQSWATPALGGYDAVPLAGDTRPVLSANSVLTQGYPAELATYTLAADAVLRSVFVPIPPGYSAWVGIHGAPSAQDFVKVTPFVGSTAGTVVHPTILSTATTTRVNTEITDATGIELSLEADGTFTLAGMIAQILPEGTTPETGGFISGQGHAGCRFMGRPSKVPFVVRSADSSQLAIRLGEVG